MKIKYNNTLFSIRPDRLKNMNFTRILGINNNKNNYKFNIGSIINKLKITNYHRISTKNGYTTKGYNYQCTKCNYNGIIAESSLLKGVSCPVCSGRIAWIGQNNIHTVASWMEKWAINPDDIKNMLPQSNKKIDCCCPYCHNYLGKRKIVCIYHHQIACPRCSDGISYPEKFMYNLLTQLNESFEYQFSPQWALKLRYDFHIKNYIIETHGLQHYQNSGRGRSLQTEQNNDVFKEQLAIKNGINKDNYIVIDCRYSNMEWIRDRILKSKLATLFDLSKIDWNQIDKLSQNSLVKIACNLWHNGIHSTTHIANKMLLNYTTIIKYLKIGNKLGWCNYDPNKSKNTILKAQKACRKNIICVNNKQVFNSITNASIKYGICQSSISQCCLHKSSFAGKLPDGTKLRWMYLSEFLEQHPEYHNDVNQIPNVIIHNDN